MLTKNRTFESNPLRVSLLLVMALLLNACASKVRVEADESADFSNLRTFGWLEPEIKEVDDPILDSDILTTRVRTAVIAELQARGFEYIDDIDVPTDFNVTYHTASKDKLRGGSRLRFGFGLGHGYRHSGFGIGYGVGYGDHGDTVHSYQQGVLILDIVDPERDVMIWRGWDTRVLSQHNFSQEVVGESVAKIVDAFSPIAARTAAP